MPIYEYQCETCGERTEALQRLDEPPLTTCARCGGPLRKLVSAPAFQFKGSGWYATDYAGKGKGGKATGQAEGAAPAAADGGGSATGAETAAAKPADPKPAGGGGSGGG